MACSILSLVSAQKKSPGEGLRAFTGLSGPSFVCRTFQAELSFSGARRSLLVLLLPYVSGAISGASTDSFQGLRLGHPISILDAQIASNCSQLNGRLAGEVISLMLLLISHSHLLCLCYGCDMRKPRGPYEEADLPLVVPPDYLLEMDLHLPGYYLLNSRGEHASAAYDSASQVRCLFGPMYGYPKEARGRAVCFKP